MIKKKESKQSSFSSAKTQLIKSGSNPKLELTPISFIISSSQ
jgi:hypothetical protein